MNDNTEFTVKIQLGWNLRITNLPSGTKYTITETAVNGYTFDSASVDNDGTFTLTAGTTTGNGTINEANKQYTVTCKNRTITQNVSIWKTDADHTAITTGAEFALYSVADYDDATETPKDGARSIKTGTTGENGILTLGGIPVGEYRFVETSTPEGYTPSSSAIRITVGENNVTALQAGSEAEVAQDVEGNAYRQYWVAGQAEGTYQIRVWNNPGVELPSTGGSGTRLFTILGSIMVAGAGVLLWRRRRTV